jgi:menaquinone-dependent protoporphyrinogen oxidase
MKTIIIYATKQGSSEKAAERIKANLSGDVQLFNLLKDNIPPLSDYDTVIIGGSIYAGKIQKKLTEYISKNLYELLNKKVGLFICAAHIDDEIRQKELVDSFPPELFKVAVAKEIFGYQIVKERLNFIEKVLVKKIMGITENTNKLSFETIDKFTKQIQQ